LKREVVFVAGIIADTHIPDRVESLHPQVLEHFNKEKVQLILHAGDICVHGGVDELEKVAPVVGVAGNRDFFIKPKLPVMRTLTLAGVPVALLHGHGTFCQYLSIKIRYMLRGYRFEDFLPVLTHVPVTTRLVIFGHSHIALYRERDGIFLFNPGSACFTLPGKPISIGILYIFSDGEFQGKIVPLEGARIKNRKWIFE